MEESSLGKEKDKEMGRKANKTRAEHFDFDNLADIGQPCDLSDMLPFKLWPTTQHLQELREVHVRRMESACAARGDSNGGDCGGDINEEINGDKSGQIDSRDTIV